MPATVESKTKLCPSCDEEKTLSEFANDKTRKSGISSWCKACRRVSATKWREQNPDYQRNRYKEHPEYTRDYYKKNKTRIDAYRNNWRKENPEKVAAQFRKHRYGITLTEYNALLDFQNSVCAICGGQPNGRELDVDHNHTTGEVRGLLCASCNKGLGFMKDDIALVENAVNYLKRITEEDK